MTAIAEPYQPGWISWAEIAALGVIWGASFLSVAIALEGFSPLWVVSGRLLIAALTLGVLCAVMGLRMPPWGERRLWAHIIGFAIFSNAVPLALTAWAQQEVASSFVGVTMALVPLFTLGLAHFLLPGERLTLPRVAGFALGLVGVVVLIGPAALSAGGGSLLARLTCVLVTLSYATGSIITRRSPPVDPIVYATAALILATLVVLPVTLIAEGLPPVPPLRPLLALLYSGFLPTALASLLMVHVIRTAGPAFLIQTNYQVPIWSVLLGTLILSEPLPPAFLIALVLILTGLAVSRLRLSWR